MQLQRIVGIVLAVIGIVLLVIGISSSESVVDQVSESLWGRFTDSTMLYIVGGIALAVLGGLMARFGGGKGGG